MRWTRLAAALAILSSAAACWAETPEWSNNNRPQPMPILQGRLLGGQSWWSRFGEPVNSVALAQAETSPSDKYAGPVPMHGDGGYVFAPGSCDCPPPCIGHLWAGYFQNPKRCRDHNLLHPHCGCNGCDNGCDNGCGNGCGHCHPFLSRIFGHGCCDTNSCTSSVSCGCAAPAYSAPAPSCAVPSCAAPSCAAPSCGAVADCCKPVCGKCRHCHIGDKWRGFMAHWNCGTGCNSCSAPVSCGCTTAAPAMPTSEKQASQGPPIPMPEEAAVYPLRRLN